MFREIAKRIFHGPARRSILRNVRGGIMKSRGEPMLDWSQCAAVESVPGRVSGAWVFRDTRLPVATVIENLEDLSVDEVVEQFDVSREQIEAVLQFVAKSLRSSVAGEPAGTFDAHSL